MSRPDPAVSVGSGVDSVSVVTVVVVTHDSEKVIGECLTTLLGGARRASDRPRILVVDNSSRDGTRDVVADLDVQLLALDSNDGFGAACNAGVARCQSKWVLLLNPDVRMTWGDVTTLASRAEAVSARATLGALGPRIERPDGRVEPSWERDLSLWREMRRRSRWRRWQEGEPSALQALEHESRELTSSSTSVDWLSGACLLVLREAYEQIGGFDEEFFLYFEDADLGRRLRDAGYENRYERGVRVVHLGGESSSHQPIRGHYRASQRRYYEKWRPLHERLLLRLLR